MHVTFEHTGDGQNGPEQCRDWRVDEHDWLEPWELREAMSHADGVRKLWRDKLGQIRVERYGGPTGEDAPALPNVEIVKVV